MNAARTVLNERLSRTEFILIISMIIAVSALAIDMMLPAFGEMRAHFGIAADSNSLAPIITFFFIGLAVGQPIWGPLSDAVGRKPVLYAGLAIYIVAAIGAAFAPSLGVLFGLRLLAGIGAAGPRVVSMSVVRDAYEGQEMAKILSYIMAVFIAVPVIAPTIGSLLLLIGPWQITFFAIAAFAVVVGIWARRLPETLTTSHQIPLELPRLLGAVGVVFSNRFTMGLTLAQTALFGFFASYLASSQLIIDDVFGLGAWFPIIFGASAGIIGLGMLLNAKLLNVAPLQMIIHRVFIAYTIAASVFAAMVLVTSGTPPFWLYVVGLAPMLLCHALLMPNLNAAAMLPMGDVAGTAAAVIGTITTLGGAIIGAFIDRSYNGTITPLAIAAVVGCIVAFALYQWVESDWSAAAQTGIESSV